jgi:hypothetical protein
VVAPDTTGVPAHSAVPAVGIGRRGEVEAAMAQMAQGAGRGARDQIIFAIILIVMGVAGLLARVWQPTGDTGGWIVAAIGVAFLGAFFYTHRFGYLVPGGIMTGLGMGIVVSQGFSWISGESEGGAVVLGLGAGFLLIWAIATLEQVAERHWWPLIPGGILATVGTALLIGGGAIRALDYWGVILVAIGLVIIARALMGTRQKS